MQAHIEELAELGVTPPSKTPLFYRVAASRVTTAETIQVSGEESSGETEYLIANIDGELWVGLGSDHTDREVEAYSITVSKQMCDKPIGSSFWPLAEVAAHWDRLIIRSHAQIDGEVQLYQEGSLSALLPPQDLLQRLSREEAPGFQPGDLLMGGTLPALGGVRPATRLTVSMEDPVLGRSLSHSYSIETLPLVG